MPDTTIPTFTTDRLTLRPLTLADAADLHAAYSDPETMHFMPLPPQKSAAATRKHLAHRMGLDGARHWAICLQDTNTAVGLVNYLGQTRFPGMGYLLRRDLWGRGLAAEACHPILSYGFDELSLDRVELWIDQHNTASQRVAAKLGFRLKSRLPQKYPHESRYHIMLVYGLRAHEWQTDQPGSKRAGQDQASPQFFRSEPVLMVPDVATAVAFYRDQLGFGVDFLYGDPPTHAAVSRGSWSGATVTIQLTQAPAARPLAPGSYLYIFVSTDIDTLYQTYHQRGVDIVSPPETYPWGLREFTIRDPHGHTLRFGTHA